MHLSAKSIDAIAPKVVPDTKLGDAVSYSTPPPKAVYCDLLIGFKSMAYVMHYSDFPH